MNIEHVDNLNSLDKLQKLGFEGPDVNLDISLGEYGIAWKELPSIEILFIYKIAPETFDRATLDKDLNVRKEFDWASWDGLFSYAGMTEEEWSRLPLQYKIYDLLLYHGCENIFGTTYWEGFKIEGLT